MYINLVKTRMTILYLLLNKRDFLRKSKTFIFVEKFQIVRRKIFQDFSSTTDIYYIVEETYASDILLGF